MTPMKHLLATGCVCLCLAACTGRPAATTFVPSADSSRTLFFKGLEELQHADSSPTLAALANRAAPDPWQSRARLLLSWQERLRRQDQGSRKELQRDLRRCREGREKLSGENAALNHDIQELKRIMVEMEKRSK